MVPRRSAAFALLPPTLSPLRLRVTRYAGHAGHAGHTAANGRDGTVADRGPDPPLTLAGPGSKWDEDPTEDLLAWDRRWLLAGQPLPVFNHGVRDGPPLQSVSDFFLKCITTWDMPICNKFVHGTKRRKKEKTSVLGNLKNVGFPRPGQ